MPRSLWQAASSEGSHWRRATRPTPWMAWISSREKKVRTPALSSTGSEFRDLQGSLSVGKEAAVVTSRAADEGERMFPVHLLLMGLNSPGADEDGQ